MSRAPNSPPLSLGLSNNSGRGSSSGGHHASGGGGRGGVTVASPTSEDDDGWTDLRADVVDSYMAEAALSEKFEGISGAGSRGSSSGSGPGARGGGGSARPPSYPGGLL